MKIEKEDKKYPNIEYLLFSRYNVKKTYILLKNKTYKKNVLIIKSRN